MIFGAQLNLFTTCFHEFAIPNPEFSRIVRPIRRIVVGSFECFDGKKMLRNQDSELGIRKNKW